MPADLTAAEQAAFVRAAFIAYETEEELAILDDATHALNDLVARIAELETALRHYAGHGYPTAEGAIARAALASPGAPS